MADDGVVDDDESIIVTKFLLNTCRLMQPTEHHAHAAAVRARSVTKQAPDDKEVDVISLLSGSVTEFYIQPMLSCVGDIDMMYHHNDQLAIPAGYPPPSQLPAEFHNRVEVYEIIDSEYPGYVYLVSSYLLTENTDADKYDAVRCKPKYMSCSNRSITEGSETHGPAQTYTIYISGKGPLLDVVRSV